MTFLVGSYLVHNDATGHHSAILHMFIIYLAII